MTLTTDHAGSIWIACDDERFVEVSRTVLDDTTIATVRLVDAFGLTNHFAFAELDARGIVPKCIDCDEGRGTCPAGRCRDCDASYVTARSSCRECLKWIWREDVGGPIGDQHKSWCSLRHVADYGARDDAELAAVRDARERGLERLLRGEAT